MDTNDPKVMRKIRNLSVQIDRNLCIGAGTCIAFAPKAWALDNEAKAIILDTAAEESDDSLINAAKGCPVAAISIIDETGKKLV